MKIAILNESKQGLGGGWSFINNFVKGSYSFNDKIQFVEPKDADIVLIPSATMTHRQTVDDLKKQGKKLILRLDNIPRNSRNRGAGTTRLYDIAQMADMVVYQSQWAFNYLNPFLNTPRWKIIYNGIDTSIFNASGAYKDFGKYQKRVLYSRYSRDETKGWERAWYQFQMIARETPDSIFVIVGRFSDDLRRYNFDFYNGENIKYYGVAESATEMAQIMRGCTHLLAPYYNDCYSNTIQEAMACELELHVEMSGGTPELLENGVIDIKDMVSNYITLFNELL